MTIFVLLCLSLLDFQHLPKSVNPFAKFVVVDAVDPTAMSGCTMNPSQGRPANVMIDQHAAGPQIELPFGCNDPLPLVADLDERYNVFTPKLVPYKPPVLPDPEPEVLVAAVPEPPTAAILCVPAIVLFYLIFGRKRMKGFR